MNSNLENEIEKLRNGMNDANTLEEVLAIQKKIKEIDFLNNNLELNKTKFVETGKIYVSELEDRKFFIIEIENNIRTVKYYKNADSTDDNNKELYGERITNDENQTYFFEYKNGEKGNGEKESVVDNDTLNLISELSIRLRNKFVQLEKKQNEATINLNKNIEIEEARQSAEQNKATEQQKKLVKFALNPNNYNFTLQSNLFEYETLENKKDSFEIRVENRKNVDNKFYELEYSFAEEVEFNDSNTIKYPRFKYGNGEWISGENINDHINFSFTEEKIKLPTGREETIQKLPFQFSHSNSIFDDVRNTKSENVIIIENAYIVKYANKNKPIDTERIGLIRIELIKKVDILPTIVSIEKPDIVKKNFNNEIIFNVEDIDSPNDKIRVEFPNISNDIGRFYFDNNDNGKIKYRFDLFDNTNNKIFIDYIIKSDTQSVFGQLELLVEDKPPEINLNQENFQIESYGEVEIEIPINDPDSANKDIRIKLIEKPKFGDFSLQRKEKNKFIYKYESTVEFSQDKIIVQAISNNLESERKEIKIINPSITYEIDTFMYSVNNEIFSSNRDVCPNLTPAYLNFNIAMKKEETSQEDICAKFKTLLQEFSNCYYKYYNGDMENDDWNNMFVAPGLHNFLYNFQLVIAYLKKTELQENTFSSDLGVNKNESNYKWKHMVENLKFEKLNPNDSISGKISLFSEVGLWQKLLDTNNPNFRVNRNASDADIYFDPGSRRYRNYIILKQDLLTNYYNNLHVFQKKLFNYTGFKEKNIFNLIICLGKGNNSKPSDLAKLICFEILPIDIPESVTKVKEVKQENEVDKESDPYDEDNIEDTQKNNSKHDIYFDKDNNPILYYIKAGGFMEYNKTQKYSFKLININNYNKSNYEKLCDVFLHIKNNEKIKDDQLETSEAIEKTIKNYFGDDIDNITSENIKTILKHDFLFGLNFESDRKEIKIINPSNLNVKYGSFSETTTASFDVDMILGEIDGDITNDATAFESQFGMGLSTSFTGEDLLDVNIDSGNTDIATGGLDLNTTGDALTVDGISYTFPLGDNLKIVAGDTDGRTLFTTACAYGGPSNILDDCANVNAGITGGETNVGASYDFGGGFTVASGIAGSSDTQTNITEEDSDTYPMNIAYTVDGGFTVASGIAGSSDTQTNITEEDSDTYPMNIAYTAVDYGVSVAYGVAETSTTEDTNTSFNAYYTPESMTIAASVGYETGDKGGTAATADEKTTFMVGSSWDEVGPGSAGIAVGQSSTVEGSDEELMYEAYYSYPINDGMTIALTPAVFGGKSTSAGIDDMTGVMVKTSFSF